MDLVLPLTAFPLPPGDPMDRMLGEAERTVAEHGSLHWMVIGGTGAERLAVSRPDLDPDQCALAATALLGRIDVEWVVTCGEAVLVSGMGVLRHAFVLRSFPGGGWEAAIRPFIAGEDIVWLSEWSHHEGDHPSHPMLGPLFPEPPEGTVRFLSDEDETVAPAAVQDVPPGATAEDITRTAGHLMESFFVSHGFVPPSVVRLIDGKLEVRLLPRQSQEHEAADLAIRLAQDAGTEAVGLFSRARDTTLQPPAEQVRLVIEFRDGPANIWRRRFRIVGENRARWLDASGEVLQAPSRARRWLP